jgi:Lrp/AsnC family leucine-responsive transcriptional regulator
MQDGCRYWVILPNLATMQLDDIDRRILAALQADGRITIQALSDLVGLSPSPCLRRVRLLETARVIRGYVAIVDQAAVELPVSVFISVKLERQREEELDRFAAAVRVWPEVVECYLMTGARDFLLRVVSRDLASFERFLRTKLTKLDGVASIESSFALGQIKFTSVLPIGSS